MALSKQGTSCADSVAISASDGTPSPPFYTKEIGGDERQTRPSHLAHFPDIRCLSFCKTGNHNSAVGQLCMSLWSGSWTIYNAGASARSSCPKTSPPTSLHNLDPALMFSVLVNAKQRFPCSLMTDAPMRKAHFLLLPAWALLRKLCQPCQSLMWAAVNFPCN